MSATILPPPESTPVPRPRRDSYTAIKRTASGQFAMPPKPVVEPREATPDEFDAAMALMERTLVEDMVRCARARARHATADAPIVRADPTATTIRPTAK